MYKYFCEWISVPLYHIRMYRNAILKMINNEQRDSRCKHTLGERCNLLKQECLCESEPEHQVQI